MGEHWIKFEPKTFGKPKVLAMKRALKIEVDAIVGKLLRVWCWADEHSVDGTSVPLHRDDIDEMCSKRGFAAAMEAVGWLSGNDGCVTFPEFWKHNGTTAKGRCVTAKRVDKHRSGNGESVTNVTATSEDCNGDSVTPALPDKKEIRLEALSPAGAPEGLPVEVNDWAQLIVAAYGRKDSLMDCLQFVASMLRRGTDKPAEVLLAVKKCSAIILAKAPQGFSTQFVPRAKPFFEEEQWRSPEAFEQRWQTKASARSTGPRQAYDIGAALTVLPHSDVMGKQPRREIPE